MQSPFLFIWLSLLVWVMRDMFKSLNNDDYDNFMYNAFIKGFNSHRGDDDNKQEV